MNEANDGQTVPLQEGGVPKANEDKAVKPETPIESPELKPSEGVVERLSHVIDRYSGLSSEMITLLTSLFREIHQSAEELNAAQSSLNLKRKEVEELLEARKSAEELTQQIDALRREKENLESALLDQRNSWEAEKARRAREEKEHYENRRIAREREEEEYRKTWADERLKARQILEEELHAERRKSLEAQEAAEKSFLERELNLKKKEQEWGQLIQELEQFLSKLAKRSRPSAPSSAAKSAEDSTARSEGTPSNMPAAGLSREDEDPPAPGNPSPSDLSSDEVLMWENTWDDNGLILDDKPLILGEGQTEEPEISPSSSRDLHILQSGKSECQNAEPAARRDSTPLKFSPRNSANHKPEE